MTPPFLLIAGREFRTYVATVSFWLSLAIAPVAAAAAMALSGGHAPPLPVAIRGGDARLTQSTRLALQEAGRLEGQFFVFEPGGARLVLLERRKEAIDLTFSNGFPLSSVSRAMVGHMIERDVARDRAQAAPFVVRGGSAHDGPDAALLSRLVTMAMLWLTLIGSLGMLLQAVVRERANRALESLLAAAPAWEIVAGKMLGVGAVSLLLLAGWLGSAAAFSHFLPLEAGLVPTILAELTTPLTLLRDGLIYVCAFAFYGSTTVALGALARDSAAAQNLVRPMFVLLLAAFFVALAAAISPTLSWLVWLPPFTPFLLLVKSSASVALELQVGLLGLLLLAALTMQSLAARLVSIAILPSQIFGSTWKKTQPLV